MDFVNSSEVDVAYHVLTQAGQTMYYKDLVLDVIDKKRKPVQPLSAAISEVYTLINMDSRFQYEGDGQWGSPSGIPPRGSAMCAAPPLLPAVQRPQPRPAALARRSWRASRNKGRSLS